MKLFFPNQKRQQIALAKNQDGARGDDFQIPESTAIPDFLPADFHSWR